MRYDLDDRGEWSKHYQSVWAKRADDDDLPNWLRVVSFAYGHHQVNGHTPCKRRELATRLGIPGEPMDRRRLHEAITRAVDKGWLDHGSTSLCLIVPDEAIEKGRPDAKREPCAGCRRRRMSASDRSLRPK